MTLETDFGVIDFLTDNGRGTDLLPEFLKNAENVKALINCIIPEIQALHDAQSDVYQTINIYAATGNLLDNIFGEIFNLERELGQTDDDYRSSLLAVSPTISGSGTITVLKQLLRDLSGSDNVSLIEVVPHTILMHAIVDDFDTTQNYYNDSMQAAKCGGIKLDLGIEESGNAFIFSSVVTGGSEGEGFATLADGSDGGAFARLLYSENIFPDLVTEDGFTMITEDTYTMISDTVT